MTPTQTRPRVTAGEALRGVAATLAVLALLVGIPAALVVVAGNPLPGALPSLHDVTGALMAPDDGTLVLAALTVAAWIGWATFAAALLLEALARVRGLPAPRLSALGVQQQAAGALVAAIALLVVAPATIPSPPAHATVPTTRQVEAASRVPAAPEPPTASDVLLVQPGDTLWDISADHLGDPRRYPEIAEATRPIVQPDGRQLTDPDLIFPGWQVHVPAPPAAPAEPESLASPPPAPPVADAAPTAGTPPPHAAGPAERTTPAPQPSAERSPAPAPAQSAADVNPASNSATANDGTADAETTAVATTAGIGALAAAGLIVLLARTRSRQQGHRRPGARLTPPDPKAVPTERSMRVAQDPLTVEHLARALRTLAAASHAAGRPLPPLLWATVTPDRVELHLSVPAAPCAPFAALTSDDTLWWLDRDADLLDPVAAAAVPCPYPALACVGRDLDGAHILLDLEEVGALHLDAPDSDDTTAVLAALTVELATSTWADDVLITLVGVCEELPKALGVDRIHHTNDLDRLLVTLEGFADSLRTAFTVAGVDGPRQARSARVVPDAWTPHVVLLGVDPTPGQVDRLRQLVAGQPRLPVAVVAAAGTPLTQTALAWRTEENLATLLPDGLSVRPQRLTGNEYEQVLELLRSAGAPPTAPGPEWTADLDTGEPTLAELAAPSVATAVDPEDGARAVNSPPAAQIETGGEDTAADVGPAPPPAPIVCVLGPVEVTNAHGEPPSQSQQARVTETVAFLALHPHPDRFLLDAAIWPGERIPDARRNQLMSRARRWLGVDQDGAPYVCMVNPAGYRLSGAAKTDWDRFQALIGTSLALAPTGDLAAALDLVRGQPFAGTNPRRYGWADPDRQEMTSAVVDVAHELSQRAQRAGDAATARRAAAAGLRVEPGSELLWRDALRAEWLAGNRQAIEEIADRLTALCEELGSDPEPDTLDLLDDLLRRRALQRATTASTPGGTGHDS